METYRYFSVTFLYRKTEAEYADKESDWGEAMVSIDLTPPPTWVAAVESAGGTTDMYEIASTNAEGTRVVTRIPKREDWCPTRHRVCQDEIEKLGAAAKQSVKAPEKVWSVEDDAAFEQQFVDNVELSDGEIGEDDDLYIDLDIEQIAKTLPSPPEVISSDSEPESDTESETDSDSSDGRAEVAAALPPPSSRGKRGRGTIGGGDHPRLRAGNGRGRGREANKGQLTDLQMGAMRAARKQEQQRWRLHRRPTLGSDLQKGAQLAARKRRVGGYLPDQRHLDRVDFPRWGRFQGGYGQGDGGAGPSSRWNNPRDREGADYQRYLSGNRQARMEAIQAHVTKGGR